MSQDETTALTTVGPEEDAFAARTRELHAAIAAAHQQIEDSLQGLQAGATETMESVREEVEERFDPRGWVQRHPWRVVGVCVAIGFYLGFRD